MFYDIFGFDEIIDAYDETRPYKSPYTPIHDNFEFIFNSIQHEYVLQSKVNGRKYNYGRFEIKNKVQLQQQLQDDEKTKIDQVVCISDTSNVTQMVVNDLEDLYTQFPDSVFQVASQFNCLEFPTPDTVPEYGISMYEYDQTQGPTSALICLPATIYRNFYIVMHSEEKGVMIGQTADNQINNLSQVEKRLDNFNKNYFTVKNGYVDSTSPALERLTKRLINEPELAQQLEDAVCVGIQTDTDSVIDPDQPVSIAAQVFCSALSCGYSSVDDINHWKPLAIIVLKAAYKCTLLHAVRNSKSKRVFLTFLGGGAFKNPIDWIIDSMCEAILEVNRVARLDIIICHYQNMDKTVQEKINDRLIA